MTNPGTPPRLLSLRSLRSLRLTGLLPMIAVAQAATIDFNRDSQPILSENCYQCHGPDAGSREAKLRLDTKEGAFTEKGSGVTPIVPGKPEDSEVIVRILSTDPDQVMPAPSSHKTLTAA